MTVRVLHPTALADTIDECLSRYEKTDLDKLIWKAIIAGWTVALINYTHTAVKEAFDDWYSDYKSVQPAVHDIAAILERRSASPTIH